MGNETGRVEIPFSDRRPRSCGPLLTAGVPDPDWSQRGLPPSIRRYVADRRRYRADRDQLPERDAAGRDCGVIFGPGIIILGIRYNKQIYDKISGSNCGCVDGVNSGVAGPVTVIA